MIELLFTACLLVAPHPCEEKAMPPFTDATILQCVLGAPPVLARWVEEHPGYRVTRWTCRDMAQLALEA